MSRRLNHAFTDYLTSHLNVQFNGVEAGFPKLMHSLHARTIDVAFVPTGFDESGILSRPLWSERPMAVLSVDHRLIENECIYWQDLRREVFVVPSGGLDARHGIIANNCEPNVLGN